MTKKNEIKKGEGISLRLTKIEAKKINVLQNYLKTVGAIEGVENPTKSDILRYIVNVYFEMVKESIKRKRGYERRGS